MGRRRRKLGLSGKLKSHPGQQTLKDLYKRKLTLRRSLQILEHTSTCNRCYQALLKIMTAK